MIELLVVIVIILILASMLLPSLQQAKLRGRIIACSSRLHQVGVGFLAFLNDNQRLPNALNIYSRSANWEWDDSNDYLGPLGSAVVQFASHGTLVNGTHGELDWIYPCGTSVDNDWLIGSVPGWCAPVRTACVEDPEWRVHIGCHISRTDRQIRGDWADRYALLTCSTSIDVSTMTANGEHLLSDEAGGTNIAFLDGHVLWRKLVGTLIAPHPTVTSMFRDYGDYSNSEGLWVFGYGSWSILLPQEANGVHPDQTNVINQTTGWPDSVVRPYWMK